MEKIIAKINLLWGAVVTLLSAAFGQYWYLFLAFFILNVVDYTTGILKARMLHTESSYKGLKGIIKKVGYWIVIALAFFISICFTNMGSIIGIDLGFTVFLGWFTLATFIINEIRSILENLVKMDVVVPEFLIKGLEVASELIEHKTEHKDGDGK